MATDKQSGLHAQAGHAGLWVAIRQISVRGLAIIQLLLLARILSPAEFGLFAVAMMVCAFIEAMTFLGFGHALILRKKVDAIHLNTLFVVNIARGALLGLLVFAISGPVAWLMESPESQPLIAAIGLLPMIMGFNNPAMILFQKELHMRKELTFYLVGALTNLCISLALAMEGYGAWSLIAGLLAQAVSQLIISYLIQSYRPDIQFSKEIFLEMFDFGKWLMASQGLKYFSNNLPSWVIGHYLGVQALGIYFVAGRFSQAVGNEFSTLISTVAFPAFSKMQEDKDRLARAYLNSQKIVLSASFLIFGSMIFLSTPFVNIILAKEWAGVESLIKLLAMVGVVQSVGAQAEIMKALNLPRIIANLSLIRLVLVASLIIPLTNLQGVDGTVTAVLIPTFLLLGPAMSIIFKNLSIRPMEYFRICAPPFFSFMILVLMPTFLELSKCRDIGSLAGLIVLCFSIYSLILLLIDRLFKVGILHQWQKLFSKDKQKVRAQRLS